MAIVLPSKKIQALIIIVAALFVAYLVSLLNVSGWYHSLTASAGKAVYNNQALVSVGTKNTVSDVDTDKDGLKDWQEALWGTDKDNPDTDGDGVKDGDEIAKGRDPKIAGPDDSLEKTRGISASSVTSFSQTVSDDDPNNLTTSISHDLFAQFMSLQSSGNLDEDSQAQIVSNVISKIDPGSIPPRYTSSDVNVVDVSSASLKAYGNALANILLTLQKTAGQNKDNDDALAQYESAITSLSALNVPSSLGLTHLQLLNNFNASYQMLVLLAAYEKDPVKGLVAVKSLQTNTEDGAALIDTIAAEMKNNDIIFDKTEAGYIWNNYR